MRDALRSPCGALAVDQRELYEWLGVLSPTGAACVHLFGQALHGYSCKPRGTPLGTVAAPSARKYTQLWRDYGPPAVLA